MDAFTVGAHHILRGMNAMTVVLMAALSADASPAVRDEVLALSKQLWDALTDGKADVWEKNLADGAVVIDEFGRRQTKAEMVKDIRPLPAGFSGSIENRDPHVRQYGDTVILDCENYEQETVFDQKLVVRYWSTSTFVRDGKGWKLAALQTVTVPTQPPLLKVADLKLEDYPGTYRYGPDRAFTVAVTGGRLSFTTKAGRPPTFLDAVARDVFMDEGEERNLLIFRRGAGGKVEELIERRKFNDLRMAREAKKE
jgi:hypothetical protein